MCPRGTPKLRNVASVDWWTRSRATEEKVGSCCLCKRKRRQVYHGVPYAQLVAVERDGFGPLARLQVKADDPVALSTIGGF